MPKIWNIYHIENCRHTTPVKSKFVVIVCSSDSKFRGFLINTKIHRFIQDRPDLLVCQALIDVSSHSFLKHDSYADCRELCEFERHELNSDNDRGPIGLKAKKAIKLAVTKSKRISPYYRNLILG